MKPKRIMIAAATVAALAAVAAVPVIVTGWFSQTFENLADGSSFTGTQGGSAGGTWKAIDAGVATVATVSGRKCIEIDTSKATSDSAIRFTASTVAPKNVVRFEFAICTEPMPWYPTVAAGEKGALVLMSNDGGLLAFGGYTASGWTTLYGRGFTQHSREWIDCRAEFDNAKLKVSYYAKLDGIDYQPLADANGNTVFDAIDVGARTISFDGRGAVGDFAGQGIEQDATRENTWTGVANNDWGNAGNWSRGSVPKDGDVAVFTKSAAVKRTVGGKPYDVVVYGSARIVLVSGTSLSVESGDVELFGDFTTWGTIAVASCATLRAQGTFYGIEMGYASTLRVAASTNVTVTTKPFLLDGVNVDLRSLAEPKASAEAFALATGPYGSGGDLLSLSIDGVAATARTGTWHGKLDGTSVLWIVNKNFADNVAVWNDGAWGNLRTESNWAGPQKPSADVAARVGNGQAHLNQWDSRQNSFAFTRYFEIGASAETTGEVDMSGGTVQGKKTADAGSPVIVGKGRGDGLLDIVGGVVRPYDHLWNYALTAGADTHAAGTVKVRGGVLDAAGGGVSVGAAGTAQMEICEGRATVGGPFAVGYAGKLDVSGGSLTVSNAVYIGRTTRSEAYDVSMTVSGGAVSNVTDGAFCVGSYGGVGSKAALAITGGEVYAFKQFVCGGYRNTRVDVAGGTLVAPEICVGQNLVDEDGTAAFGLASGRVETAGFTSGVGGVCTVTLAGGELVATAANGDFFKGLESVRLEGETEIRNAADIATSAGLVGPGGFVKTGAGTLRIDGYAAWAGKTTVLEGTLDMNGGMAMGEFEVADGASVVNAKYDNVDVLSFSAKPWSSGTASSSKYLRIYKSVVAKAGNIVKATDGDNILKGAISFAESDGGTTFAGWTAFGWTDLSFADGTAVVAGQSYDVQMKFDFDGRQYYVMYYAKQGGAYSRLVSADGLTAFPVAGTLASVKTFDGTGEQLTVDAAKTFYWIGGANGNWSDGNKWSHTRGGAAAKAVPGAGAAAFVDTAAVIDVAGAANPVASFVANAHVTLANGTLKVSDRAFGAGTLVLSNATVSTALVELPLEPAAGTDNAVEGNNTRLNGALKGTGSLAVSAKVCGDTSAFAGTLRLIDGAIGATSAADNARAAWQVFGSSYPFAVAGAGYSFGALNGTVAAGAGDPDDVTLTVGSRNEDCALDGGWLTKSRVGIDWTAPSATLTYAVTNAAHLGIAGGGKVALGIADGLPERISFRENGGTLSFAGGTACDLPTVLKDSTAAMAFDDGGKDYAWGTALDGSNVGGFVKRGAGTLTLAAVPQYRGATVVEEGVLVVPYGTRLDSLTVSRSGKIVLDMAGKTSAGTALAIGSASRDLLDGKLNPIDKYLVISNAVPGYSIVSTANRGLVISYGSDTFVWTGKTDSRWALAGNWTVGGKAATRYPSEQDDVCFTTNATVDIGLAAAARTITGGGNLCLKNSGTLTVVGSMTLASGMLAFDGNATLDAADVFVASLSGTGTVQVTSKSLELSPLPGMASTFVGTLNVTNFTKGGEGSFEYEPLSAFRGAVAVTGGILRWNCRNGDMTNQVSAAVRMSAGAILDLCEQTVTIGSFTGAGIVRNGKLITADGVVTQSGGALSIPAVDKTTYVASRAGEKLEITDAADASVRIVIPRTWFVAGVSGKRAVYCDSSVVVWDIRSRAATEPKPEGDGWWSISGGGMAVRLR